MPQYVLVLDAHAMGHIPDDDMPDVDKAAHAVSQEAIEAGVWVCGSGLQDQRASIVAADETVTDGPPVTVGRLAVIEVLLHEEAHKYAADADVRYAGSVDERSPGTHQLRPAVRGELAVTTSPWTADTPGRARRTLPVDVPVRAAVPVVGLGGVRSAWTSPVLSAVAHGLIR